jgi:hypothetical protein
MIRILIRAHNTWARIATNKNQTPRLLLSRQRKRPVNVLQQDRACRSNFANKGVDVVCLDVDMGIGSLVEGMEGVKVYWRVGRRVLGEEEVGSEDAGG